MEPFDLKMALHGKPVQTRDGRKILQVSVCWKAEPDSQIAAWIDNGHIFRYNMDGQLHGYLNNKADLFMVSEIETPRTNKMFDGSFKLYSDFHKLCKELETELNELKSKHDCCK